jgi:hypothetical protein
VIATPARLPARYERCNQLILLFFFLTPPPLHLCTSCLGAATSIFIALSGPKKQSYAVEHVEPWQFGPARVYHLHRPGCLKAHSNDGLKFI